MIKIPLILSISGIILCLFEYINGLPLICTYGKFILIIGLGLFFINLLFKNLPNHVEWLIFFGFVAPLTVIIFSLDFVSPQYKKSLVLSTIGISSFLVSLIWMDYLNHKNKEKLRKKIINNKELIHQLLKELPLSDKIAILFEDSSGSLNRKEIRRALLISFSIIFILLLFFDESQSRLRDFIIVYSFAITFYFGSRGLETYFMETYFNYKKII